MIEHQVYSNAFACLPEYVNLVVIFPIWSHPSIFMDVAMLEHRTFDAEVFRCDNPTQSSLLISCKLSFTIVGLKVSSSLLALKSPKRIFVWYVGNLSNTRSLIEAALHIISFVICWSMNV
jgi:hypothetical protein